MANASNAQAATPAAQGLSDRRRSSIQRIGLALLAILLLAAVYLLFAPSPIDPVAYEPPSKPALTGPWEPNTRLRDAEALAVGKLVGPEDVETDKEGRIYTGLADGRIVRITADGAVEDFVNTGGRPLGLEFDPQDNLLVADAIQGLLSVSPAGKIRVLATEAEGEPLGFTDDVDVASNGVVYFTDASVKFGNNEYLYDLLEARPHGRLIAYDPSTEKPTVLLSGLYFANGVALSKDEDFVLVNETYRYRVTRYWLKGPRAGSSEIFVDNLPGFPDNISSNRQGKFWLALFTIRNDTLDWLSPRPSLKRILSRLPKAVWPAPERYGVVVAIDEQGHILESLHDPGGQKFWEITSAHPRDGYLYLGSLSGDRIGKYRLP